MPDWLKQNNLMS